MNKNIFAAAFTFVFLAFSSISHGFLTDATFFDFVGWDHDIVSSPSGQTFTDIFEDVDVTVSLIGTFDVDTGFGGGFVDTGGHLVPGSHSLRFTFSENIPTVVEYATVDSDETLSVFNAGSEQSFPISGAAPTVAFPSGGISVTGNGQGIDPVTGASSGQILTNGTFLTVTHTATADLKFERVRIGTLVPEPNSFGLIAIGGLALIGKRRRRRK